MAMNRLHTLHARRMRRNVTIGLVLGGFVILVFALTVVKMSQGNMMEAFDHVVRPSLLEKDR